MKKNTLTVFLAITLFFWGAHYAEATPPTITSILPSFILVNSDNVVINVTSAVDPAGYQVYFGENPLTTEILPRFGDGYPMRATIPATLLREVGAYSITLRSTIDASPPRTIRVVRRPVLESISPVEIPAGSGDEGIRAYGEEFYNGYGIYLDNRHWLGGTLGRVGPDQYIQATIPADELRDSRTASVVVWSGYGFDVISNAKELRIVGAEEAPEENDLLEQLLIIQGQIIQLQEQLNELLETQEGPIVTPVDQLDLKIISLQKFLNNHGFPVAKEGPGSPGQETNYFGKLTQESLRNFQAANGLPKTASVSGVFWPWTKNLIYQISKGLLDVR